MFFVRCICIRVCLFILRYVITYRDSFNYLTIYPPNYFIVILVELKLFRFDNKDVNDFEILLIDITFHLQHVQKMICDVLIKKKKNEMGSGAYRVEGAYDPTGNPCGFITLSDSVRIQASMHLGVFSTAKY